VPVARITTNWIRSHARATIAFFFKLTWETRATVHAPGEIETRSLVKYNTEFIERTRCRRTVSRCIAVLYTRNKKCNVDAIRASRWLAPRVQFPSWGTLSKELCRHSLASLALHADHACRNASSWCHIHTSLLIYLGSSRSLSSFTMILQGYVQRP